MNFFFSAKIQFINFAINFSDAVCTFLISILRWQQLYDNAWHRNIFKGQFKAILNIMFPMWSNTFCVLLCWSEIKDRHYCWRKVNITQIRFFLNFNTETIDLIESKLYINQFEYFWITFLLLYFSTWRSNQRRYTMGFVILQKWKKVK